MIERIRVLVVDDSVVVRKAVTEMLGSDPEIEVIGTAANGKLALERVLQHLPDVLVMDVEMPEMDGLAALRQLRRTHPELPVLMFSALTEKGAMLTLDALAAGASDYVTKPSNVGRHQVTLERVRGELVAKVRALGMRAPRPAPAGPPTPPLPARAAVKGARVELVVIGASTGGPNAVVEVLGGLAPGLRVPVLIVQHMPPVFTRFFAERLASQHGLDAKEAEEGETIGARQVRVAPGDFHLIVRRDGAALRLGLSRGPPENSCRPAVDVLFRSAAEACGRGALGVVLTGMGQDGLRGSEHVRRAGGQVLAQDPASSVVWSMPGAVARAGLADEVLPLRDIAADILRRVGPASLRGAGDRGPPW
jgi:two-component system chemotaxis response regulator CheB